MDIFNKKKIKELEAEIGILLEHIDAIMDYLAIDIKMDSSRLRIVKLKAKSAEEKKTANQ